MRKYIAVLSGLIILIIINFSIYQREQLLKQGRVVLLELIPVDPRSIMQGDYMALRFKIANDAFPRNELKNLKDGQIVASLDEQGVGHFKSVYDGKQIEANEVLMRYRIRNDQPKFATNAFFFQEGHAKDYASARYGEFRVAANGDMILTAMRDPDFKRLGTANR